MGGDAAEVSNLNITLHPLVVINISDHYTRARAQAAVAPAPGGGAASSTPPCVYGAVLGEQVGRRVELANSFELKVAKAPNGTDVIDMEYLRMRLDQYKKTYPKYDMLGWYCTRGELLPSDLELQARLHRTAGSKTSQPYRG